jgi:hypothetical protein
VTTTFCGSAGILRDPVCGPKNREIFPGRTGSIAGILPRMTEDIYLKGLFWKILNDIGTFFPDTRKAGHAMNRNPARRPVFPARSPVSYIWGKE